jgi:hypothetical protein
LHALRVNLSGYPGGRVCSPGVDILTLLLCSGFVKYCRGFGIICKSLVLTYCFIESKIVSYPDSEFLSPEALFAIEFYYIDFQDPR